MTYPLIQLMGRGIQSRDNLSKIARLLLHIQIIKLENVKMFPTRTSTIQKFMLKKC